ncbi:hypothetical protein VARIO8X_130126 [Burkholderiales bacterium 8X]|nr:hypothetical protein VARIO8X_130126 [Burkholderiales bacterium 8X]
MHVHRSLSRTVITGCPSHSDLAQWFFARIARVALAAGDAVAHPVGDFGQVPLAVVRLRTGDEAHPIRVVDLVCRVFAVRGSRLFDGPSADLAIVRQEARGDCIEVFLERGTLSAAVVRASLQGLGGAVVLEKEVCEFLQLGRCAGGPALIGQAEHPRCVGVGHVVVGSGVAAGLGAEADLGCIASSQRHGQAADHRSELHRVVSLAVGLCGQLADGSAEGSCRAAAAVASHRANGTACNGMRHLVGEDVERLVLGEVTDGACAGCCGGVDQRRLEPLLQVLLEAAALDGAVDDRLGCIGCQVLAQAQRGLADRSFHDRKPNLIDIHEARSSRKDSVSTSQSKSTATGVFGHVVVAPTNASRANGLDRESDIAVTSKIQSAKGSILLQADQIALQGAQIDAAKDLTLEARQIAARAATSSASMSAEERTRNTTLGSYFGGDAGRGFKARNTDAAESTVTQLAPNSLSGANVNLGPLAGDFDRPTKQRRIVAPNLIQDDPSRTIRKPRVRTDRTTQIRLRPGPAVVQDRALAIHIELLIEVARNPCSGGRRDVHHRHAVRRHQHLRPMHRSRRRQSRNLRRRRTRDQRQAGDRDDSPTTSHAKRRARFSSFHLGHPSRGGIQKL